jgi:D-aspartate ligase
MRRAFSSINKLHRRQLGKMNDAWTTDMSVAEITKRATASHPGTLQGKREAPGAVVLGGDFLGLGIVRSLGRKGVAVCVVDDEHSIARFSRFTTCAARVPNLREESRIVGSLLDLGRRLRLRGWLLYPTREEIVAALSRNRAALAEVFRVTTPPWRTVRWAWDKRNTYRLANQLAIPAPRTWYLRDVDGLESVDGNPPWVIKPAIKENFIYATKAKAWRANNRAELNQRFAQAAKLVGPGEVMVQELIPGDGNQQFAYCAFFKEGRAVGSMTVRRRRQHPPEFGRASTLVETIEEPILEKLSKRFLRAIDYYGLVELEYKFDTQNRQFKLLDVNARAWGYHTLGVCSGVDFSYLLFADQMGEPLATCRARVGVKWIRLVTDVPTGALEVWRGSLAWREYLRSLANVQAESVFCRDDPLPGFMELALIPYLAIKRGF